MADAINRDHTTYDEGLLQVDNAPITPQLRRRAVHVDHPDNPRYGALVDLYERYGGLTPEMVLQAARPTESVLHDAFDWDNDHAAHAWRLAQARRLIRSFKVRIFTSDVEVVAVRAFVHEPQRESYGQVEEVVNDVDRRAAQVARLRTEYVSLGRRAAHFDEFAEIVAVTDLVLARDV